MSNPREFEVKSSATTESIGLNSFDEKKSGKYSDVFDPKMRKKLSDYVPPKAQAKSEKYKTTYLPDGRMMAEVGDGRCIISFPKSDNRERGTLWSTNTVQCGKSDSEKFMDNVARDLEERKGKSKD